MSGIRQDVNYVEDGWTAIAGALSPLRSSEIEKRLGRPPTVEERALLTEIFDHQIMNKIRARVDEVVKDRATAEALKPWYRWICKRPCFHDDYLASFNRANVTLVDTQGRGVERLTRHGMVSGGKEYKVDCIIFATGFEAGIGYTRLTGFEIVGRGGLSLSDHWRTGVRTLHGMMTDQFPNCFFLGGNQQTAAATNAVQLLDEQAVHVAFIMNSVKARSKQFIEASADAIDDYVQLIRTSPKNLALLSFYQECTPGYYNAEGKAKKSEELFFGGRYGDGPIPFFRMLESWRANGQLKGLNLYGSRRSDSSDELSRVESA
jgi:cation diffusion facilitator CzcD-associated flavoprotein CzcO